MDVISARGLSVNRGNSKVIKDVSLSIASGEWVALLGPNGAGKSTLLSSISGLLPYTGSVQLDGQELSKLKPRQIASRLAVVRQSTPLLFDFSVHELVLLGLSTQSSILKSFTRDDYDRATEALIAVDLVGFESRSVLELSGGERQRVFLAQALLQQPAVLILDEPTTHLDVHHQYAFLNNVKARVESGLAVVSAFHDLTLAARYADRVCVLDEGEISALGEPRSVITPELVKSVFRMDSRTHTRGDGHLAIDFISPS